MPAMRFAPTTPIRWHALLIGAPLASRHAAADSPDPDQMQRRAALANIGSRCGRISAQQDADSA
jgi:hypothetical protein